MNAFSIWWADALLRASLQGGIAILVLFLVLRVCKRIPPLVQVWAWRLLLLKLLVTLFAPITLEKGLVTSGAGPAVQPLLPSMILALSAACASLVSFALLKDLSAVRALRGGAKPLSSGLLNELAHTLGLRGIPALLESRAIQTPLLLGCIKPAIVLPEGFGHIYGVASFRMVLAHELAHHRHRDLAWAWLKAAAQLLFYFHPLVQLALRELHQAEEAAADRAAITATGARLSTYGSLLIDLSRHLSQNPSFRFAAAVASPAPSLSRRLKLLASNQSSRTLSVVVAIAAAASVPGYKFVAQQQVPRPISVAAMEGPTPAVSPAARSAVSHDLSAGASLKRPLPLEGN